MTGPPVIGEMTLDTNPPNSEGWCRGRHRTEEAQRGNVGPVLEAQENFPKERIFRLGFEAPIGVFPVEKWKVGEQYSQNGQYAQSPTES